LGAEWLDGLSWRMLPDGGAAAGMLLARDTGLAHETGLARDAGQPLSVSQPLPNVPADGTISTQAAQATFATLAAEAPIVWLLPRDAQPAAALSPLGSTDAGAVAAASFVTPSGQHIEFVSSDPAAGLGGGLFIDADTRTILTGSGMDHSLAGPDNQIVLRGDNGNLTMTAFGGLFERVTLLDGSSYTLAAAAGDVASGHTLTVSAFGLGAGNHLSFDGSAVTEGRFVIGGGAGDDLLVGGGSADAIEGGRGADTLTGGGGADRFLYTAAADSTGAHYDTITDFAFGSDLIDLPVSVTGLDAAVTKGALSQGSFDADLAAALGPAVLGAGHALFFTPDSGQLAGQTFLVVDANGEAGYQAGVDFVIHFASVPPADLHGTGFLA
jgi:Ca2+-binding RTX toxin-like protein